MPPLQTEGSRQVMHPTLTYTQSTRGAYTSRHRLPTLALITHDLGQLKLLSLMSKVRTSVRPSICPVTKPHMCSLSPSLPPPVPSPPLQAIQLKIKLGSPTRWTSPHLLRRSGRSCHPSPSSIRNYRWLRWVLGTPRVDDLSSAISPGVPLSRLDTSPYSKSLGAL
jgi:hypothetical protein